MFSPKVVVAGHAFSTIRQQLSEEIPDVEFRALELSEIQEQGCSADILIPTMSRIDGGVMDRVSGLRLIQQWGYGLEGVDVPAASERRIPVARVPTAGTGNAESVAEWCVMAAIGVSRRVPTIRKAMRSGGVWGEPVGRALMGRTAGIVGLGGLGQELAKRLKPFGMRMVGIKRRPDDDLAQRLGLDWLGTPDRLPDLLRQSDYLFLCAPLSDETRKMIDEKAIALLPPMACIINAGRGALIDQDAVLRALDERRLLGVALDVYEQEPLSPDSQLLGREDMLLTDHIAGVTDISYRLIGRSVADNISRIFNGEPPKSCVNWDAISGA